MAKVIDDVIRSNGRLIYIEPNDFAKYAIKLETGTEEELDNFSWGQEDLQYSVDLQVVKGDRYNENCAVQNTPNTQIFGGSSWISFMEGTSFSDSNGENINFLTDAYTEISFQEFSNDGISQKESLGINSIQINFDSHFFPLVTIKFTDVRAAALFGPSEYGFLQQQRAIAQSTELDIEKTSKSFFKALFRFPYPRFMLSIMGFYGDKVTFQLAVNDFKTNFNSQTGNFDVTVSFIGYMYGVYTDMPMSIVMMAPYYNSEYWEKKKADGTFTYNNNGSNGSPILTFIEYLDKYYRMYEELNEDGNTNQIKEYKYMCAKKTQLTNIMELYNDFEAQFTSPVGASYLNNETYNPYTSAVDLLLVSKSSELNIEANIFENLNKAINDFNDSYNDGDPIELDEVLIYNFKNQSKCKFNTIINNKIEPSSTVSDGVKKQINELNEINKNGYPYSYYYVFQRGNFKENLKNKIDKVNDEITSIKSDADNVMNDIIQTKLSFKPTVENIYRMIFAHIETFINSFDKLVSVIGEKKTDRTCGKLGLRPENSDIPFGTKRDNTFVPPFPLCKQPNGEVKYPGTFFELPQVNNIDEVDYIEDIVNGIKTFTNQANLALEKINSLSDSSENFNYQPITHSDIFYNQQNPYSVLKKKLLNAQDDNTKAKLVEYFFFSRLVMNSLARDYGKLDHRLKDDFEKEYSNFKSAEIVLSDNVKQILKNNLKLEKTKEKWLYNENNIDNDNKIKEPYCYFSSNPFSQNGIDNLVTERKRITILKTDEYKEKVQYLKDNGLDIVENNDARSQWGPLSLNSDDEYSLSYILPSGKTRDDIGFVGDVEKNTNTFTELYTKQTINGQQATEEYHTGFLQVGSVEKNSKTVNNTYLGCPNGEDGVLSITGQTNRKFRGFLLLGSLCSYYNTFSDIPLFDNTTTTMQSSAGAYNQYGKTVLKKGSNIARLPKALLLYYGACIYFRKHGFSETGINLNHSVLNKLNSFILETEPKNIYGGVMAYYNTFTSKRHIFLDDISNEDDYIKILLYKSQKFENELETNFVDWAESEEFSNIDSLFKNTTNNDKEVITLKKDTKTSGYNKFHHEDINIYEWKKNSQQDIEIKNLLCEDVYIFYQPSDDRIIYTDAVEKLLKEKFANTKSDEDLKEAERKEREKNNTNNEDQKKALYYTLKTLYDKWLSSYKLDKDNNPFSLRTPKEDFESRKERFNSTGSTNGSKHNSEFNNFIFVDSFYRDIANKFLINPTTLCDLIKGYISEDVIKSQMSVFEFMNEIAEKNNLLFACLPVYNNLYSKEGLLKMFTPNKKYDIFGGLSTGERVSIPCNTYMLMYTGEASSKLDIGDECGFENDGILDVFDSSQSKLAADIEDIFKVKNESDSIDYTIPAFGVTYARQDQMYFKDITVNMDNPKVTDYSIANLIQISYGGKRGDLESYNVGVGQDIYSIYSNRSYTCTVEMMGCLNIMPMMYFQLNNIPMFRGVYIIINVSHSVEPGKVTTKFTGVRVSKNHIGEVKMIFDYQSLFEKLDISGSGLYLIQPESTGPCDENIDLSVPVGDKNLFKLSYFISSSTARKYGICNLPKEGVDTDKVKDADELKERINEFCKEILEPLYEACKQRFGYGFIISSGYRNTELNKKIGGASNSSHSYGYATDIQPNKANANLNDFKKFVYNWLKTYRSGKYDQFINEFKKNKETGSITSWVHIGYKNYNTETKRWEQRGENLCYKAWRSQKYTVINNENDLDECNKLV